MTPGDLVRAVNAGRPPAWVRVPFDDRLAPTADPTVFEYRPGDLFPPSIRIEFAAPPTFGAGPGCVVVGRFVGVIPDGKRRPNGAAGCVLLTSAAVVAARLKSP